MGFALNGIEAQELTLTRGVTYTFTVNAPGHSFYLTTDAAGGSAAGEVTTGVTNNEIASGVLTFTPSASNPDLLYYQCAIHTYMGWKIHLVNPTTAY